VEKAVEVVDTVMEEVEEVEEVIKDLVKGVTVKVAVAMMGLVVEMVEVMV
jgi:hypothetical protein